MLNIGKAAVLGAGTMGAAIAAHLSNAGIPTLLLDIAPQDADDLLGREVEVDLGGGQPIMAEEPLQGWQPDPLLHRRHRKGVAQHVRRHRPADPTSDRRCATGRRPW